MIARACAAFGKTGLRLCLQLWPLWLAWGALQLSLRLWRDGVLLSADMDRASVDYAFASAAWPSAGLFGPILLMLIALALHRAGHAARVTALSGVGGVALGTKEEVAKTSALPIPQITRASRNHASGSVESMAMI